MAHENCGNSHLCFVESSQLRGPLMYPLDVRTAEGERIGCLDGVVVDRDEHRARYLVVDRGRFRPNRCLVPFPARLDLIHQSLRVDANEVDSDDWEEFDADSFPPLNG
jgi:sporulation protein YlmC with PRC-barrel domain